ncbi:MAG: bifunctional 4-hydroxy-2-oxoglutarate aldolase/2-dehydro-3-deoxy-phosphogluconate aldolase [Opitutales bacterium]
MSKDFSIENRIRANRIMPIAVVSSSEDGPRLAEALLAGGIDLLEITLRTEAARSALRETRRRFPDILLGAGTILDAEIIPELVEDGIDFGVSPGLDADVVSACSGSSFPLFPGVLTPTEVSKALSMGCKTLKFFPAEPAGGAVYLKALAAPFKAEGVQFVPTGNITLTEAPSYWALPEVIAVGGSWLVTGKMVAANRFDEITRLAKEALALRQEN